MSHAASSARRARGFSMIELMVALVAGLIVSYAIVAFAMSSMKSNAEYVQATKLTQSLRNTLDVVVRDLRRAGYDDNSLARLSGGNTNSLVGQSPFSKIYLTTVTGQGDCIIYSYDRPGGTAGTLDQGNEEIRGLRMRMVTPSNTGLQVGVVEYAKSNGTAKPACTDGSATYTTFPASCDANTVWCPLTDPSTINISAFRIVETSGTILGSNPSAVRIRNLEVDLNGRLVGDNGTSYLNGTAQSFRRGLRATIKVRTDCVNTTISNCDAPY